MTTGNSAALAVVPAGPGLAKIEPSSYVDPSTRFTPEQEDLIRATCCGGASKAEADVLISIAEARGLNPILGECYFVLRDGKWAVQASIDSFRIKAERTGLYVGQDEPEYEYDSAGALVLARVRVWRRDWPRPSVGVARFSEYVQTTKEGAATKFWRKMPHNQLAKCAEASAMRKAFPAVFAKIYVTEEMQQADNVVDAEVVPPPPPSSRPAESAAEAFKRISDLIDAAESSKDLSPIVGETRNAAAKKVITKEQFDLLSELYAMKRHIIVQMEAPSRDTATLLKDFESRIGELVGKKGSLVDLRALGADVSRSPLDAQQREYLQNVYDLALNALETEGS